jgi:ribosomal protein S18 acetylase RimI-like enzyme
MTVPGEGATLTRRPAREDDGPFLQELYASTREQELSLMPLSEQEKQAFVRFQFDAQRAHYSRHFPGASHEVIFFDGVPAGRFYVQRTASEIRVIDIALLTEFRGRGIGSKLLGEVLNEAPRYGGEVVIHVERENRARGLYERLGFEVSEDLGVYLKMHWSAAVKAQAKTAS